jgi:prepilin signal peptidase PulO-like enzyme (type II secretory pathway)
MSCYGASCCLLKKEKVEKYNKELPFGPFLLLGMYITGVLGVNIFTLISKMVQ